MGWEGGLLSLGNSSERQVRGTEGIRGTERHGAGGEESKLE